MKKLATIIMIVISLVMATSIIPSTTYAAIEINGYEADEANIFEGALSDLLIEIGDFFVNLMNKVVGEKVTMQNVVFNQVSSLDPNFFNKDLAVVNETTALVREKVNEWYSFFMMLAIVAYLVVLLVIGIKIAVGSTASGLEKAKELATKWLVGVLILFLFPSLVLKNAFKVNEAIVKMISDQHGGNNQVGTAIGNTEGEWANEEIEFRSPEYVSRFTGKSSLGGEDMNLIYQKALDSYRSGADMTRIMRAYAGITRKLIYVIIWYVLLTQLIVLIVLYYKRYFTIAFLIVIFPLVAMYYIIEIARGKNGQVFSEWSKEILVNIFIQTIHAIVYAIIASVAISRVQADIASGSDAMNWLLIIVAVNFITEGEKIVRKLVGVDGKNAGAMGAMGQSIKNAPGKAKGIVDKAAK